MNLMDDIWYICGDRSLDFNWYSKRFLLSGNHPILSRIGIYTSTELFYLNDQSKNKTQTVKFLDRRLKDSFQFSKAVSDLSNASKLYSSSFRLSGFHKD